MESVKKVRDFLVKWLGRRGRNNRARELRDALGNKARFDKEKKELVYQLGCVFEKLGRKEDAIDQFKLIYEMDIGYRDVATKVDNYYLAGG